MKIKGEVDARIKDGKNTTDMPLSDNLQSKPRFQSYMVSRDARRHVTARRRCARPRTVGSFTARGMCVSVNTTRTPLRYVYGVQHMKYRCLKLIFISYSRHSL